MKPTNPCQQEAIERAEVLTCCHPPMVAEAVLARIAAHDDWYLLDRLDVRHAGQEYQITIHGHLYRASAPHIPHEPLVEHVTIPADDDSVPAERSHGAT